MKQEKGRDLWCRRMLCAMVGWLLASGVGCRTDRATALPEDSPERRALAYLAREVPSWSADNGCFSCHNNGDGARALFRARELGMALGGGDPLGDTVKWVADPGGWRKNKGEPGVSDECLARIQFGASLAAAYRAGMLTRRSALEDAGRLIVEYQEPDGSWIIEPKGALGSPATHGQHLATAMALDLLRLSGPQIWGREIDRAEAWLRAANPRNRVEAAGVLLGLRGASEAPELRERCLSVMGNGRSSEGAWGPYAAAPPEPFDTAVVVLALLETRRVVEGGRREEVTEWIRAGRAFLVASQLEEGGWVETTRPSGGVSYAQHVSTTGWATLALLESRLVQAGDAHGP